MALFLRKQKSDILQEALTKLQRGTAVSATSPGTIARAFTEAITSEIADLYDAMDFQVAQSVISTASGSSLDLLGQLYNVKRRTISDIVAIDRQIGAFYFYVDSPAVADITIPTGIKIYTSVDTFIGRQLSYSTTDPVTIFAGQTRAFAGIVPDFFDAVFTAAPNTLAIHSFPSPPGVVVRCTNPKAIQGQVGFEDDENYRIRLIKSIRVAAAGTIEAIRYTALAQDGVRDAKINETPYGLGSFQLIVTPENKDFSNSAASAVIAALEKVRPVGVKMFVTVPTLVSVDITMNLILSNPQDPSVNIMQRRADVALKRYLNSLLPGDELVYNKIIQNVLDISPSILDVQVTRFAPNGKDVLRRNFKPDQDEMLIPGTITVAVLAT